MILIKKDATSKTVERSVATAASIFTNAGNLKIFQIKTSTPKVPLS